MDACQPADGREEDHVVPDVTKILTQQRLKELLRYDPVTGLWAWLQHQGGPRREDGAGTLAKSGGGSGRRIQVDGISYRASHLAFLYITGALPTKKHVCNRDKNILNDAWDNLYQSDTLERKIFITSSWTPEQEDLLRTLWQEGHSAAQIAHTIGGDITRNAVIGKARRLNLPPHKHISVARPRAPRGPRIRKEPVSRRMRAICEAVEMAAAPSPEITDMPLIKFDDLNDGTCRWPIGDELPYLFCGKPSHDALPYCSGHCRVAYFDTERMRQRKRHGSFLHGRR